MRNPWLRTALVLLVAAALGGAGWGVYRLESDRSSARASASDLNRQIQALEIAIGDLQASEQASVARGQGEEFWLNRAGTLAHAVETSLARAREDASDPEVAASLESAASVFENYRRVEAKARGYVLGSQHLLASDVIFTELLELAGQLRRHLEDARVASEMASAATDSALRRREAFTLGAAAAVALLVVFLFAGFREQGSQGEATPGTQPAEESLGNRRLGLRELQALEKIIAQPEKGAASAPARRPSVRPAATARVAEATGGEGGNGDAAASSDAASGIAGTRDRASTAAAQDVGARSGAAAPATPEPPTPAAAATPSPDLEEAARLCADFARVAEAGELPGLLERASSLLGASGVMVWIQNPAGTALIPTVGHGYAQGVMARMQPVAREADNLVADVFRAGETRVVSGDDAGAKGAVVAPLLTPAGPVGVLAVEVPPGSEKSRAVQAMASIVASQLSSLVPAPPAQGS